MAVDVSRIGGLWLVYGIPGTGKTLLGALADGIIPAVQHGRTVFTNVSGLSIAGIASITGVPPAFVDVRFLDGIPDVVAAFDAEDSKNCLFVLDEMKQVLASDKNSESWLCQRLNIMRKRSNDFIMIAQVPEYFSKEIRSLAKGCTLYKRLYAFGSKTRTREYRFDGGDVVISSGKLQPAAYKVRRLPVELFTCYQSGIDGLIGVEDNGRVNSFWKSPKAILGYLFILFVLLMVAFGVYMFFNIKGSVGSLSSSIVGTPPAPVSGSHIQSKAVHYDDEEKRSCYTRKVCDSTDCTTDAGAFPLASWSSDFGGFLTPSGLVRRCSRRD